MQQCDHRGDKVDDAGIPTPLPQQPHTRPLWPKCSSACSRSSLFVPTSSTLCLHGVYWMCCNSWSYANTEPQGALGALETFIRYGGWTKFCQFKNIACNSTVECGYTLPPSPPMFNVETACPGEGGVRWKIFCQSTLKYGGEGEAIATYYT